LQRVAIGGDEVSSDDCEIRTKAVGKVDSTANLVGGHEVADVNVAELSDFQTIETRRQIRDLDVNAVELEIEPFFTESVSRCHEGNGAGNVGGRTKKSSACRTGKLGLTVRTSPSGDPVPESLKKLDDFDSQKAKERAKEPKLRHGDQEGKRSASGKRVEEHAVHNDENQECDKRVENCIACAAEIGTLDVLNKCESPSNPKSLSEKK